MAADSPWTEKDFELGASLASIAENLAGLGTPHFSSQRVSVLLLIAAAAVIEKHSKCSRELAFVTARNGLMLLQHGAGVRGEIEAMDKLRQACIDFWHRDVLKDSELLVATRKLAEAIDPEALKRRDDLYQC